MTMWDRAGLIGGTGFVGGNLARQRPFARSYSSRTIDKIAGEHFDTLICAGAPAVMWAANADPEGDRDRLKTLSDHIATSQFDRLILISTIAVLDDLAAGFTEGDDRYEAVQAYGRNRRELEQRLIDTHGAMVLRLPALFGQGLRKNYLYDLAHPLPSFLKGERFRALYGRFDDRAASALQAGYAYSPDMDMMELDRATVAERGEEAMLVAAFDRERATAKYFTNDQSTYQFYCVDRLSDDIERMAAASIDLLHLCSVPISAADIHSAVFDEPFDNAGPGIVQQDMRTCHAAAWGRTDAYLYDRAPMLDDITAFVKAYAT